MSTDIDRITVQSFKNGYLPVTTSATKIVSDNEVKKIYKGILLVAHPANTDIIYVGAPTVTADTNPDTGGIPLSPDASVTLPISHAEILSAISTSGGQHLSWTLV